MTSTAAARSSVAALPRPRARPSLLDLALGVAVGASLLWAMTFAAGLGSPSELPPIPMIAHVAVVVGVALWRAAPRTGLVLAMLGVGAYHALGGVPVGLAWPLVLPCYGVARRGHLAVGVGVATVHLTMMLTYRWVVAADVEALVTLHTIAQEGLLLAGALLVGEVVRSRAKLAEDAEERVELLERRHQQETERRIAEERLRIAHDVHDVAAHTVSVIALHANVAKERFDADADEARAAIETIRSTSQQAARDLRAVVGLLRDGDDEPPTVGLTTIRSAVDRAASAGLHVQLHLDVGEGVLDGVVEVAASRIVQESLTNVLRHARADRVDVHVVAKDGALAIRISDDGCGRPADAPPGTGVGLLGMRERARALGGTCSWTNRRPHGFEVTCQLPLRGEA